MKRIFKFSLIFLSTVLFMVVIMAGVFLVYYNHNFQNKVWPNVFFYDAKMTGKSLDEVEKIVANKKQTFPTEVNLQYDGKETKTSLSDLGFIWDDAKTTADIFNVGQQGNYIENFFSFIHQLFSKKSFTYQHNIDNNKIDGFLKELSSSIDKEPIDGKFEIANNKVTSFAIGSDGKKLLIPESETSIFSAITREQNNAQLVVQELKAKGSEDIDKMGVKEVVATGQSSFAGSPPNRIHNITVGSQVFNGVLIAPGENFSFISALGDVSAKTGYLPELVIKEDKTIPEYGGGLCQVSTTFFRAAINAGFPILERTAHAYRVVYYEPAGFDSTIYDPKPDLVFTNDTKNYILIQTRISGTDLFVDFYGTNDGRKVEVSKSTVYNLVAPGDPIITETSDLKPGEKKQTDTAHTGADAYFTRKITYADGTVKNDRFDSHYIPWRAKFLVGKELAKGPETNSNSNSTSSAPDSVQAPANNN